MAGAVARGVGVRARACGSGLLLLVALVLVGTARAARAATTAVPLPAAVVLNIRAHTLAEWLSDPVGTFSQLLDVETQAAQAWAGTPEPVRRVPYAVTVPFFFDNEGNILEVNG